MANETEKGTAQPSIPGIDLAGIERANKKRALDELMLDNPFPTTKKEADKFLRRHTVTTITLKSVDADYMKVVMKFKNVEDDKEKYEFGGELNATEPDAYDQQFIAYAQKGHHLWADVESPKYYRK